MKSQSSSAKRDTRTPIKISVDAELLSFMPKYLANRKADLLKLEQSLREGDFNSIERLSHKIRGHATGYGMPELTDICRSLELAARMKAAPQIEDLLTV